MKITDKYILFWDGIFGNFYPCKINYLGNEFSSSEQLFMYLKAKYFKDFETMELILKAKSPKEAKSLGRKVKNFEDEAWKLERLKAMTTAVTEKFKQNSDLLEELLNPKIERLSFVEASPYDQIWGIGWHVIDLEAESEETWRGLNLLGKVLNNVRLNFRNGNS